MLFEIVAVENGSEEVTAPKMERLKKTVLIDVEKFILIYIIFKLFVRLVCFGWILIL
jgi:hypothetical protein